MIIDNPSKRYEIVLGSTKTTTDMPVCISYEDVPEGITGALDTQTNGTTAVPLLTMTEARTKRALKEMTVNNVDTLPKTVTIRLVNGSTTRQVYSCVLQVGDMLGYTETAGFYVKDSNGNTKTIAAPNTATSGISPVTSSASPDIFGAAGYTINLDNSTPVTTTSFAACTSAQVGSAKKVIPAQNWNVTASANLVVDGATSGTFLMPAGAILEVLAASTTTFKVTTIFATGTWTATFTGFTTSPTSVFKYTKIGRTVHVTPVTTAIAATSNATTKTATGMPSGLIPSDITYLASAAADNGGARAFASCRIFTDGTITFYKDASGNAFTASGTAELILYAFTYTL